MGRVYSAVFEEGDSKATPEWPPHPSRLFSALTAAWGEGGAEEELRPALEWIEQQAPPRILFGPHTTRQRVQAFVPVNDAETPPEDRPRKGRTFPSASLADPDVYFIWDAVPHAEIREKLDRILLRTSSLGHSASVVSVELSDGRTSKTLTEWQPGAPRGERLRVPYSGRLNELIERHRRFEKDGAKIHRPTGGRSVLYAPRESGPAQALCGVFGEMIVLKKSANDRKASLRSTLSITAALRGAVMSRAPQPVPEFISGHAPGSTPEAPIRTEAPHLAFIPLPNVGFPYSSGEVLGAAIVLPRGLTAEQRRVSWKAAGEIQKLTMDWSEWSVGLADAEDERHTLLPQTWTRPSCVWATVTPFVFDRYPKDPFGEEAEETVRRAFPRAGFPEPVEVDLHYNSWHSAAPRASAFAPVPARNGKPQRYHCHVRARFDVDVAGPVLAGAGRFYGYGLFRQLADTGGTR
jgi:CRISPR-associated protein Csb2